MNCMATLKHIASKNSDYSAAEAYLIYQHDEFTGKQLLDEQGRPMLRESYILDTLECGDYSFATACLLANRKYGKNTQHGDIKSHQYIISFDPRDSADNGLTMEKSQALGLKFCEENFPGHPAIVCTHPDGHNHSRNIHVHIVFGSVRTREVERKPYMQKPRDWREGMKHSSTAQTMRHLRVEVMELCEGAGLYQIDLLNGSKERVSEAEYWARRRGQLKLDRENAALLACHRVRAHHGVLGHRGPCHARQAAPHRHGGKPEVQRVALGGRREQRSRRPFRQLASGRRGALAAPGVANCRVALQCERFIINQKGIP